MRMPHLSQVRKVMATPVCGASLAVFRISYGLVMFLHLSKALDKVGDKLAIDWVYTKWPWHFRYPAFEWVHPLPAPLLEIHFVALSVAAILVMIGLFYRVAITYLFFGYTYVFLLEAIFYNNHYYLMCLVAFLLIWMPADARISVSSLIRSRRCRKENQPECGGTVPFWNIWILRFQLFVVYFYGGIAKFNRDWLTGEPIWGAGEKLYDFFDDSIGMPVWIGLKDVCLFLAWGGLIFDLAVGFMLLHRKTRWIAFLAACLFHLHNHFIFSIGVFPLLATAATLIFFSPDWPMKFTNRFLKIVRVEWRWVNAETKKASKSLIKPITWYFFLIFVVWQIVWPFRHFRIEGDANWTEEGHGFSWRMMLRAKTTGSLAYWIKDKDAMVGADNTLDWKNLPDIVPRAVFITINSDHFNWSEHTGPIITWEPILGYRVFFRSPSGENDVSTKAIAAEWKRMFNREPTIQTPISFQTAINEIESLISDSVVDEERIALREYIARIRKDYNAIVSGDKKSELARVTIMNSINSLTMGAAGNEITSILKGIHPFALQGAPFDEKSLFVINDGGINYGDAEVELAVLSQGKPFKVWVDMMRLRSPDWRQFPRVYVASEGGGLRVFWNYFHDMSAKQAADFTYNPFFIRQYGRYVAKEWEKMTGSRPEVRVSNTVMLNYHYPKPLIDPNVDIAKVPYYFHKHNSWITERPDKRIGIGEIAQ